MTLGQKLKNIRKKFGLSQEELANLIKVSRQAITKWENDLGLPDTENLKELSKLFGVTIDYLLDNNTDLPLLVMRKNLDKTKYKSKLSSYEEILKEYYSEPWEIYILTRERNMNKLERLVDFFVDIMPITLADITGDISPYYLVKKDDLKLLVNIKDWVLEVTELDSNINEKKFVVGKNVFHKHQKLNLNK